MYRRGLQTPVQRLVQVIPAMYETAARAAKRERRPDHQRETDLLCEFLSLQEGIGRFGGGHRNAQGDHPLTEFLTVLRLIDRLDVYTDEPDPVFFPDTQVFRLFGEVQRRLPAHSR